LGFSSVFFGLHFSILAQSGIVIVSNDSKPLPYASVINMRTGRGVFGSVNGQVDLNSTLFSAGDTIKITYTGYEERFIKLPILQPTIVLKSQPIELDPVAVYPCPNAIPIILKNYSKFVSDYSLGTGTNPSGSWAAFIPNIDNVRGILETITMELSFWSVPSNARKAPFKLRLLSYDSSSGLPGSPLIAKEWVVHPKGKKLILPIIEENLRLPKQGIVVAIDYFFAGEQYLYKRNLRMSKPDGNHKDTVVTYYGSHIRAARAQNLLGKGYSYFYKTGKWYPFTSYQSGIGAPMVSLGIKVCK